MIIVFTGAVRDISVSSASEFFLQGYLLSHFIPELLDCFAVWKEIESRVNGSPTRANLGMSSSIERRGNRQVSLK